MKQNKYSKTKVVQFVVVLFGISLYSSIQASTFNNINFQAVVENSKMASVPQRVQVGPTCGLYALGMVMDYWHNQSDKNPTALVSQEDLNAPGVQYNFQPTTSEEILSYVQRSGFTFSGEMFVAKLLAQTAMHFGYHVNYYSHASLNDLYRILDRHHPAIIAFDVDDSGNPTLLHGKRAHYAVIEGYFDYEGTSYVIAKHGWGTQKDYVWKANDLIKSMKNLQYTNYYSSTAAEPSNVHLPAFQNNNRLIDISESLADQIIEVVPAES